ncbi:GNAT family N-acetyltransferase [Rhizobium sp. TRM95111]|uniref:GNAT family N-acetyltransferase n=1 Tax=Rhizobium alarense TaxID=2846851 RepID=UPI001F3C8EB8|nr:GNAT family N-acetyltransferase [Rhizobium alarense]MCF3640721.1 GNAT family N-acetyltransferase [Rhizobium alarense]
MSGDAVLPIRAARAADLPGLLNLYSQLNPRDPPLAPAVAEKRFASMLAHPGLSVLAAFDGRTPVASCTLVIVPNLTRGAAPYALIENVVTDKAWRRKGVGRAVLLRAVADAFAAGCYKTMLMTGRSDPGTHDFYRRCGFMQDKTGFQIRNDKAGQTVRKP